MRLFIHISIFIVSIACLFIAYYSGPLGNFDSIVLVNDSYIQSLQKQYIYSGVVTAVISCVTAYLCRASFKIVAVILLISGVIWVALSQLGEPDFSYFLSAVVEFMIPYALVCLTVLMVLFGVNKKWPRLT